MKRNKLDIKKVIKKKIENNYKNNNYINKRKVSKKNDERRMGVGNVIKNNVIKNNVIKNNVIKNNVIKNNVNYSRITKSPKIGILIVNYNNLEYTKNCVNDIINQINQNFILYVVDQNSNEKDTDKYLNNLDGKYDNIKIVKNNENVPLNWVWNNFYEICDLEYLCFLNNDIRLTNNFIDDTHSTFKLEPSVGAIIHVTNNLNYIKTEHKLKYEILTPPLYQGWDFTLKRCCYKKIPTNLKIFGGDDYLFANLINNNNNVALIYSSPIIHYKERTRIKITNISDIQKNDAKNYWDEIKKDKLKQIGSTVPTKCNKYPSNNIKLLQNKNCIYTASIGDYDILHTSNCGKLDNWDYICFTDNKNLKSDFWKIIYVENQHNNSLNNIKLARYYKTNPFKFLSSYENIIWKDSRISINSNLNNYLLLLKDNDMFFMKHYCCNSILIEFDNVLSGRLETEEMINKIKLKYCNDNYHYDNGLFATGILMYKNNIRVRKLFKNWWNEINENSHRDQLSLNYVLFKNPNIKYSSDKQLKILSHSNMSYFKVNNRTKKRYVC